MVSQHIILLNHRKRKRIQTLARKTRNKIVYRRCQIVLHLAQRRHPHALALALGCDVSTVYRTRKAFLGAGESALRPKQSPGRPRKLTLRDLRRLDDALAHEPSALGKNFSNWSVQKRCAFALGDPCRHPPTLSLAFAVALVPPRATDCQSRSALCCKARYLRRLRRQAHNHQIHLYYADEMDLALLPTISGRWMRRGQQTQVLTPGQNAKQYVFGAVNAITGQLIALPWANKNNVGFQQLLKRIWAFHESAQDKIVVVVDNFCIHHAKAARAWLKSHRPRLRLYFLPTYSPHLNPIERVWRHVRRNVTDNYFFRTLSRLMAAVEAFLSEMAESPAVILKIVA